MIDKLLKKEYIILEIIPTAVKGGDIAQLSALKLKGLQLIDRFDYRLNNIGNPYIEEIIDYDKDNFTYKDSTSDIIKDFKTFIGKDLLLIIDNEYTKNYLEDIKNKKESIFSYLGTTCYDEVFNELKEKYNLEDSNYIVDLLYESLIYESNNK